MLDPYATETPMPWMREGAPKAACADSYLFSDAWFPDKGITTNEQTTAAARDLCRQCPIRTECLQWALDEQIDHGLWGGLTRVQRRRLVRERWAA